MSWSPQGRSVGHNRASKPTHVSRLSPSPGEGRAGVRGSTASSHLSPMFSRREEEGTVGLPGGQRCAQVRDEAQGGVQAFRAMPGFPELLASLHLGPTPSRVFRMKGACSQSHGPPSPLFSSLVSLLSPLSLLLQHLSPVIFARIISQAAACSLARGLFGLECLGC